MANLSYCRFSYAKTLELLNLLEGTKCFSYHIYYENLAKYSTVKRQARQPKAKVIKKSVLND